MSIASKGAAAKPVPKPFLPQLVATALFVQLTIIGLASWWLYQSHTQYRQRAEVATQNLAQLLEHDLASSFDKIDLAILTVKDEVERQIAIDPSQRPDLSAYIRQQIARQPDIDVLRIADAQGQVGDGKGTDIAGQSIASRSYFMQLRDQPQAGLVISKPLIGMTSGKWGIALARRINHPDGSFAGIVVAAIYLERFQQLFATLQLGGRGVVSLRDADLGTVVRQPEPQGLGTAIGNRTHSREWPEKLKSNPIFGTYFAVGLDQRARVLSYHKVGTYPFYVIVGLYPNDYLADWRQEAVRTAIVLAVFIFITTLCVWLVAGAWRRNDNDARRVEQLSHRLIDVQEQERRNLALALHDEVSPNLAALRLTLSTIAKRLGGDMSPSQVPLHADMHALLDETAVSLRRICANLRPALLDYSGLVPALQGYAEQFAGAAAISVTVSGSRAGERLPPNRESLLFRIAQEAITNSVKHARARAITIELMQEARSTRLTIADDGIGFDVSSLYGNGAAPGLGLLTMRERAEFIGAAFHIASHPDQGTRITVEM